LEEEQNIARAFETKMVHTCYPVRCVYKCQLPLDSETAGSGSMLVKVGPLSHLQVLDDVPSIFSHHPVCEQDETAAES
jgi:hypothetical protein